MATAIVAPLSIYLTWEIWRWSILSTRQSWKNTPFSASTAYSTSQKVNAKMYSKWNSPFLARSWIQRVKNTYLLFREFIMCDYLGGFQGEKQRLENELKVRHSVWKAAVWSLTGIIISQIPTLRCSYPSKKLTFRILFHGISSVYDNNLDCFVSEQFSVKLWDAYATWLVGLNSRVARYAKPVNDFIEIIIFYEQKSHSLSKISTSLPWTTS